MLKGPAPVLSDRACKPSTIWFFKVPLRAVTELFWCFLGKLTDDVCNIGLFVVEIPFLVTRVRRNNSGLGDRVWNSLLGKYHSNSRGLGTNSYLHRAWPSAWSTSKPWLHSMFTGTGFQKEQTSVATNHLPSSQLFIYKVAAGPSAGEWSVLALVWSAGLGGKYTQVWEALLLSSSAGPLVSLSGGP